jgi:hypothetical protein
MEKLAAYKKKMEPKFERKQSNNYNFQRREMMERRLNKWKKSKLEIRINGIFNCQLEIGSVNLQF